MALDALPLGLLLLVGLAIGIDDLAQQLRLSPRGQPLSQAVPAVLGDVLVRVALDLLLLLPMLGLVLAALRSTAGRQPAWRAAALAAAVLTGALFYGQWMEPGLCLLDRLPAVRTRCEAWQWLSWTRAGYAAQALVWGGLIALLLAWDQRARDTASALHHARMRRLQAERDEDEARLVSLQAQIEPHFLFNTLAHLLRLHEVNPAKGLAMLRSLAAYVQSTLPEMRARRATLRRELAATLAYAEVQQVRMGEGLAVTVDIPDELLDAELPTMMLLTLAENAIKHGLSPRPGGGTLRLEARADGRWLKLAVVDDGVGLKLGAGGGRGLANTRSRLAAVQGELDIVNQPSGGVRASLWLPLTWAAR